MFQLGGLVQLDGRFAPDDPLHQVEDEFVMRRVRTILQGRLAKYFEFRVMPDFGNGTTVLYDAYIDVRFSQTFRVRLGKDKTPVGLEQLYSDYALLFPERSLASNLVPNRDVGVQAQGEVAGVRQLHRRRLQRRARRRERGRRQRHAARTSRAG